MFEKEEILNFTVYGLLENNVSKLPFVVYYWQKDLPEFDIPKGRVVRITVDLVAEAKLNNVAE